MDTFPAALIDAMGGTTVVARLMNAPVSTVNNMRTRRVTGSRLNHLRRIALAEFPNLDVEAIAANHGVELPTMGDGSGASSGSSIEISRQAAA
ncbi:hypothetical protein [Sphingomonas sp. RIT328]|uniref:hypothetical protein n=1 Tax=Sphingomonas sp. RIT328 TaxID=1470591 RepID=UPI00137869F5|nr:hypothetical protein [Sphingomonas sp. RIT328]